MSINEKEIIFDWNRTHNTDSFEKTFLVKINDETLREGIQSPSTSIPTLEEMKSILMLMDKIQIDSACIGFPSSSQKNKQSVEDMVEFAVNNKLKITLACAGRTVGEDIEAIIDISQQYGVSIEANLFIGSSPIRRYVEEWDMKFVLKSIEKAVYFAVKNEVPVCFITEDTTRSRLEDLNAIYRAAINSGAYRICVCDTVGHATPEGVTNILSNIKDIIRSSNPAVLIDWHGHNDRGLACINALTAAKCGVDRIHATGLGIGERVGNTSMEQLLVNLMLMGITDKNVKYLKEYCNTVSQAFNFPIPNNLPIVGHDAFRTGTGVHAAAIIKAKEKGNTQLADLVYTAVPAGELNLKQIIEVGPMSGKANIIEWMKRRSIQFNDDIVQKIFQEAKLGNKVLSNEDISKIVKKYHPDIVRGWDMP